MIRNISMMVILISTISMAGCNRRVVEFPSISDADLVYLRSLDPTNAEIDAKAAFEKGDRRFLGVYGAADSPPGIGRKYAAMLDVNGIKMIEGTSDFLAGEEYNKLNDKATTYAEKYNLEILNLSIERSR